MQCLSSQHLVFYNHMYFYQGVSRGIFCVLKCKIKINTFSALEVSASFDVNMSTLLPTVNMFFSSIGCYYKQ